MTKVIRSRSSRSATRVAAEVAPAGLPAFAPAPARAPQTPGSTVPHACVANGRFGGVSVISTFLDEVTAPGLASERSVVLHAWGVCR